MKDYELDKRQYVIAGVAIAIVAIYIVRLFTLQIMSDDYKKNADSNAFLKKVEFPSRGIIYDRNGKTLVFNQPSYDIMVIVNEQRSRLDTTELCKALNITREYFIKRMSDIQDRSKNPGYSSYTQQLFMSQLSDQEFSVFQEKAYKFPGFYIQRRSIRQYEYPNAALLLGDVAEVSPDDIKEDEYYQPGDYIGKVGVERSYEKELRGTKGVKILLRDNYGRIQGNFQNGKFDTKPIPGKKLTLGIDIELQRLGERLLEGKLGSIVAIEPSTGEILCMVSSPSYDPRIMVGRQRGKNHLALQKDPSKPLLNRAIMGQYPPGSTFKTSQALTFLSEGVIDSTTKYPCHRGFVTRGMKVGCHGHPSPLNLIPAIGTSCNGFFCWGLYYMLNNRDKYPTLQVSMDTWRDYMKSMGFGYKLGVDLPNEKRGMIPNATYYDKAFKRNWNALGVISIAIGQGEVTLTPLQIANLGATIANRGWFITPHVVKEIEGQPIDTLYTNKRYTKANAQAYNLVVRGMRRAVTGGTCRSANRRDYEVCGKTGTAQNRGRDHSVFMGFAPMNEPKIAISVYVENGGFGATFGVPIGSLMMEQYIKGELSEGSKRQAARIQSQHLKYGTKDR
jgi:penicillin-binding protein 2